MQESFLHYIWQFQYFDKWALNTAGGEPVEVFYPGTGNGDAGPDFLNAKVRIGSIDWAGNVEIHTRASAWYEHGHHTDAAYSNVVLHVVWINDKDVRREDGTLMPTLELQGRIDQSLMDDYRKLVENPNTIPCSNSFETTSNIVKLSMLDKALMQRLEQKATQILQLATATTFDWEEITYQIIGRNFGFKVNNEPFFQLVNAVPRKMLLRHSDSLMVMEAILFGQAGFLNFGLKDDYFKTLQREYQALAAKYGLTASKLNHTMWRFLRLRPANFPTLRLAQFGALFFHSGNLFARLIETTSYDQLAALLAAEPSAYWHSHYRFGRPTARSWAKMGKESVDNLIINSVAPLWVAYGKYSDNQALIDRAVAFLQKVPAEKNKITRIWDGLGYRSQSAFDSQALIELHNHFCAKRKCLHCNIGIEILKPAKP